MSFIPYLQRQAHRELSPGDFCRIQNSFFIIDEVRRFRFPFVFEASGVLDITELTGRLKSRFRHIDKFAMAATLATTTVSITYRNTDVTGLQFAHVFTTVNANLGSPDQLDINSFSREDIIRVTVTFPVGETEATLWFSGEEYTLVAFPEDGGPNGDGVPERFVIVVPYGFSKVNRAEVFKDAQIAQRLRT